MLNHSAMDGFDRLTDCPGTTSARSVPLVPRSTSSALPSSRGVKGRPEAMVQSPLHCQSPKIASHRFILGEPAVVVPEGKLPQIIRRELVRLIEAGKPSLRGQVERVLCDARCSGACRCTAARRAGSPTAESAARHGRSRSRADRRRIVNRFGVRVDPADGESVRQSLSQAHRPGVRFQIRPQSSRR